MTRARAFTLYEIIIVLAIMATVTGPILAVVVSMYRQFHSLAMVAGLREESDTAGNAVLRLVAAGGTWHLDRDNHGVQFSNGNAARWVRGRLRLMDHGHRVVRSFPDVKDLAMVRHGQVLSVTVYVAGPERPGGPPIASHQTYESEARR
ncbi:MAG TPA: type II secretion system protein [Candidatus Xenobia bacterium]|jgi:prepilin-type N-terminal cleavage/methylation domain-containing protein